MDRSSSEQPNHLTDNGSSESSESLSRCTYVVPRKKRRCRMLVRVGQLYCGEHALHDQRSQTKGHKSSEEALRDRIPCPFDPKHTCDKSKLDRHLSRCAARAAALAAPPHCQRGANVPTLQHLVAEGIRQLDETKPLTVATVSDEMLLEIIAKIERICDDEGVKSFEQRPTGPPVSHRLLAHKALDEAVASPGLGPAGKKHLLQNASLLAHLDEANLLHDPSVFVEFGSGRGQLTYWLAKALDQRASQYDFVLVDKASHRHKFDNKLKDDEALSVYRVRADIQDLVLSKAPGVEGNTKPLVGVSKHLCGAATDLALRCMANMTNEPSTNLGGLMVALCCHHRCDWKLFAGKEYLIDRGLGQPDVFGLLCGLTSWATCGTGKPRAAATNEDKAAQVSAHFEGPRDDRYGRLNLPRQRREHVGRQTKRVLDMARADFVRRRLGLQANLFYYCDPEVSLENVVLISTPNAK